MNGWMDDLNCIPDNLPFDQAGPSIRRVATQAGYGGAIVGRSNPFGFIYDAIRGFCMPAAMREDGNGGYEDLSGMGASSPDLALPAEDVGYGFGVFGPSGGGGGGPQGGSVPAERPAKEMMAGRIDVSVPVGKIVDIAPSPIEMGMEPMRSCPSGSSFNPGFGFCVPDILTGILPMAGGLGGGMAFEPGGGGAGSCDRAPRDQARQRLRQAVASCDRAGAEQVLAYAEGCRSSKRSGRSGADLFRLIGEAKRAVSEIDRKCQNAVKAQSQMAPQMAMEMPTRRAGFLRPGPSMPSTLSMTEGNARMRARGEPMTGAVDPSAIIRTPRSRRPRLGG